MKISVIIPVYNAERYIGRCIDSVKAQTYKDWECIVINDGSTDGTAEELSKLTVGDGRFKVVTFKKNGGIPNARNRGIAASKGDALFFVDDDDWLDNDALAHVVDVAGAFPSAGRIFTQPYTFFESNGQSHVWSVRPLGVHKADSLHLFKDRTCDVGHCTGCLYVKKNIPCEIRFPKKVKIFDDMIFNMGLIFSGIETVITGRIPYHYTRRKDSFSASYLFNEQDAEDARKALADLAKEFHPSRAVYERCWQFMENTVNGKLNQLK